jgi:hypothetical protein
VRRFATGPVRRGRFAASRLISVSTIESKSTNPSVDAPKNVFSLSTNKQHELPFRPVISSNICFAFSLLSIPYCSDSGIFFFNLKFIIPAK